MAIKAADREVRGFFLIAPEAFVLGESVGPDLLRGIPNMATKTEEKTGENKVIAARNKNLDLAIQQIA
ncbi:MAG TPA: hypothetical protein DCG89_08365, partial [Spartobacteria bacterium]|nr:hypothetical protein [Spartobacteria bacterium]